MRKHLLFGMLLVLLLTAAAPSAPVSNEDIGPGRQTADELIAAVNALRAANGLPAYTPNAILMSIAQAQANYMAAIGTWTHTGPDGSRPYERALAAGYLVAGDLTQGGWFSENVGLGNNLSVDGIIQMWMSDAPHQNTMLSPTLREIGAGVAFSGNTVYYVIDCGLSTGGTPVAYTPRAILPTQTILPNTPNADGSIIHIVRKGDTIYGIAFAYGVPPEAIFALNGLTASSTIYTGQKIYVRAAFTPTATLPTATPTHLPTATLWPTSTATATVTPLLPASPTPLRSGRLPPASAGGAAIAIIVTALVAAGIITLWGKKKP